MNENEWILCPICKNKTRRVRHDFPLPGTSDQHRAGEQV
ncbi:cysteine-rich KTR domain-containing protein [Enterocloster bolteae]